MIGKGFTRRTALAGVAGACATRPEVRVKPIVIAHRGASGERPEHTASAYRLAIAQGADFIEPDLVLTKDNVLVCRHENEIGQTTDVAAHPEFAARRATKTIDGASVSGWFTEDFTLAELKTLRCRERLPQLRPANTRYDGADPILTFDELLDLAAEEGARAGRVIGVYPETKHPSYFDGLGLSHDKPLLDALARRGFTDAAAPVFIQSFEVGNLKRLAVKTEVRRIQLASGAGGPADAPGVTYRAMLADGLQDIARHAHGIGVEKSLIVDRGTPTDLIARAHGAGLKVHAWTFRAENHFLPAGLRRGTDPAAHGDLAAEIAQHLALGLDGLFCDFPAIAVAARG